MFLIVSLTPSIYPVMCLICSKPSSSLHRVYSPTKLTALNRIERGPTFLTHQVFRQMMSQIYANLDILSVYKIKILVHLGSEFWTLLLVIFFLPVVDWWNLTELVRCSDLCKTILVSFLFWGYNTKTTLIPPFIYPFSHQYKWATTVC